MGIIIKGLKEKDNEILCYVDASFANTKERKSIYGYIIFINQTPVHFKCKKQPMITLSTTEAEFLGISFAIQEVKWIMNLLEELKINFVTPKILSDNKAAVYIINNETNVGRTKHMDIKYKFIKEMVLEGRIEVEHIEGEKNIADIFTKALPKPRFKLLRDEILYDKHLYENEQMRGSVIGNNTPEIVIGNNIPGIDDKDHLSKRRIMESRDGNGN